ncbi:F0F1 ATP synthase subunit epsilon [Pleurocapsales cyanobacterium LEGE 06147]|nr:F0F1 ATP synthase subunit epsilon [Pleurocapsales cyanobacterium LEGE 06147]
MVLSLKVITPDKTVWDDKVEEIILPSTTGQLGILSGHAPLLSALDVGVMRIRPGKDWKAIALMGGFAEVENNEVKVLVNSAEMGDSIDREAARTEFEQAQSRFNEVDKNGDRQQKFQAKQALKRARARFQAAGGMVSV